MTDESKSVAFSELVKLYMQQFGMLTFGTVTVLIMQHVIVTPQLERNQEAAKTQQQLIQELHNLTTELDELAKHARQTAELQDRALLRLESGK